jgi:hypothetical protein
MDSNLWSPFRMGALSCRLNDAESNVPRFGTAAFRGEGQRVRIGLPLGAGERTAIACPQPIARPKVADAGEDRVGRWIDERIDLARRAGC